MKRRELENLGFQDKATQELAGRTIKRALGASIDKLQIRILLQNLLSSPSEYLKDEVFSELASAVIADAGRATKRARVSDTFTPQLDLEYAVWGEDLEAEAHQQMKNACSLPIARAAALMPDAHTGYGLPIGGVLATENAVIPYAVGVDIACRVMISICDFPVKKLLGERLKLESIIDTHTRFGIGANFSEKKYHPVLDDAAWSTSTITQTVKDTAWKQLGTSGSGNHFVEFGVVEFADEFQGLAAGKYFAIVSHSGSRGPGSKIANHYSALAQRLHPELPRHLAHLAWLDLATDGQEYWEAMELMGRFASANHQLIHRDILKALGTQRLAQVENHHNFAWKEQHLGKELIVHRKGATPAGKGVLGYIPGTMVDPGFIVEGLGNEASLSSSSHGAGRKMSRKQATLSTTHSELKKVLLEKGVSLLSAGLDESPHAYKDIAAVMNAQKDLVRILAKFIPKIVKMAPAGEKAED